MPSVCKPMARQQAHIAQQGVLELPDMHGRVAGAEAGFPHQLFRVVGPPFVEGVTEEQSSHHCR